MKQIVKKTGHPQAFCTLAVVRTFVKPYKHVKNKYIVIGLDESSIRSPTLSSLQSQASGDIFYYYIPFTLTSG